MDQAAPRPPDVGVRGLIKRSGEARRAAILDEAKTWPLKLLVGFALGAFIPLLLYLVLLSLSFFLGVEESLAQRFLRISHLVAIAGFCMGTVPLAVWNIVDLCRIARRGMKEE